MLLERVQVLTSLLESEGIGVGMPALAEALRDALSDASVYVVSRRGRLLGYALPAGMESTPFDEQWLSAEQLPDHLASGVLKVGAVSTGVEAQHVTGAACSAIFPLVGAGRRIGTLLVVGRQGPLSEDDLVLAQIAAIAASLVVSAALDDEEEDEVKEKHMARSAVRSLSYSEVLAMHHIFQELKGDEGLLVASRIADQAGITRSVIVNALRKLSSANVIESRSLGMKGTYLRVLNKEIRTELNRQRYPNVAAAGMARYRA